MSRIILISFLFFTCMTRAAELDLSLLSKEAQNELLEKFPTFKQSSFSPEQLNQAIVFLISNKSYDYVQVSKSQRGQKTIFRIYGERARRLSKISIEGADAFSSAEIKSVLGLEIGSVYDSAKAFTAQERLANFYREQGYLNSDIALSPVVVGTTEAELMVSIHENRPARLRSISISTPNQRLRTDLERVLRKDLDSIYTEKLLSELIKNAKEYLTQNGYYRSDLDNQRQIFSDDKTSVSLSWSIEQSNRYELDFDNNGPLSKADLRSFLKLDSYKSSNPNISVEIANRIKSYYLSQGYARAEVSATESNGQLPFRKLITVHIDAGPLVKIQNIEFKGHYSLPQEDYADLLKKYSNGPTAKGKYVAEDLDQSLKSLILNRQNQGYLKARVISSRRLYVSPKKDRMSISINFEEGPLTVVQKIILEGVHAFPESELLDIIAKSGVKPQEALHLDALDDVIRSIQSFYHERGYLDMSITNINDDLLVFNEENTLVHLKLKIFEGPKVVVGSIAIEGNTFTKDFVIEKELDFHVGQVLTPDLIKESTRRLQRLGLFSNVEIRTLEERTQVANRTVVVRVADRDPGLFNVGIGATNERNLTLRGYTGVVYRNLFGTARALNLRIDANYNISEVRFPELKTSIGYLEPYLLGSRVRGKVNYTQATYISNYESRTAGEVKQTVWSAEYHLNSHTTLTWDAYNLAQYRDFSIDTGRDANTVDIRSTGATVEFDYRDHQWNPTNGILSRFAFEYGSPALGSSRFIEYVRSTALFTHYLPLSKRWVWANSISGGLVRNLKADGYVPYDKKGFSLGGPSTIRGYSPDEAFPNSKDLNVEISYPLTTEAQMSLFKSELRFPLPYSSSLVGAVFYDSGRVDIKDIHPSLPYAQTSGFRQAAGVALRWITPVEIPVSIEIGWKLDGEARRRESASAIHLSIGAF